MKKIVLSCSLSLLLATCFAQTAEDYAERGDALYRAGLYEQALTEYDTAIALKPGWMDPYLHKGMALEFLRRFSDGIDTYNTLLKKDAGNLRSCGSVSSQSKRPCPRMGSRFLPCNTHTHQYIVQHRSMDKSLSGTVTDQLFLRGLLPLL